MPLRGVLPHHVPLVVGGRRDVGIRLVAGCGGDRDRGRVEDRSARGDPSAANVVIDAVREVVPHDQVVGAVEGHRRSQLACGGCRDHDWSCVEGDAARGEAGSEHVIAVRGTAVLVPHHHEVGSVEAHCGVGVVELGTNARDGGLGTDGRVERQGVLGAIEHPTRYHELQALPVDDGHRTVPNSAG